MKTRIILAAIAVGSTACAVAQNAPQPQPQQPQYQQRAQQPGQDAPRAQQPGQGASRAHPGLSAFGWFAELANACWRGERENRADVQCYTTQYNRFMRGTIKFYQGGNVVGEGDSVFAYEPNAQVIVYSQWGSNGALGLGEVTLEGADMIFRTRLPDGSEPPTRSVWRRVDADTFRVVRQRRAEGDAWTEDLAVTYKRVVPTQPAAAPAKG